MHGTLVTMAADGSNPSVRQDPARDDVAAALAATDLFWLDLASVDEETLTLLRETFRFHPLAVEDADHFGQRPKIDRYDDFALLVAYGMPARGEPIELHFFCGESFVVTLHRTESPGLTSALAHVAGHPVAPNTTMLLHRLLDGVVDSYEPVLETMAEEIDALEDAILRRPTDDQLRTLFELKRRLARVRRLASEQRDMLNSALTDDQALPGMTGDAERYFRDIYDHLIRISSTADNHRDLLSSVLDTHLSTTSNRLNVIMKQMTIIATVFLPLTFLTGFFGQNFGWLVAEIGGAWVFWTAGVGLPVATAIALYVMFRHKGWLSSDAD